MKEQQTVLIARHLYEIGSLTPLQALRLYGCFRLAARIKDLRDEGFDIETEIVRRGKKRFAKYVLEAYPECWEKSLKRAA